MKVRLRAKRVRKKISLEITGTGDGSEIQLLSIRKSYNSSISSRKRLSRSIPRYQHSIKRLKRKLISSIFFSKVTTIH